MLHTNSTRQMISVKSLDVLDLKRVQIEIIQPQQSNGILRNHVSAVI